MKRSLELPLPPSVNALYINRRNSYKRILSEEGRAYIYVYSMEIKNYLRKVKHVAFDNYFYLDMDWFLPRKNADSHNYLKALLDMLQIAGFVTDDRYVMTRTQSVTIQPKDPKVLITWNV